MIGTAAQAGVARQELVDRLLAFLGLERAGAIDERAARLDSVGRAGEQAALQGRERGEIGLGCLSQGMSGWRRIVPVDEHGASSSTASNGPPCHCVGIGGDDLGGELEPREVLRAAARAGLASGRPR